MFADVAKVEVSLYQQFTLILSNQMCVFTLFEQKDRCLMQNIIVLKFCLWCLIQNDQFLHNQIKSAVIFTLIYLFSLINK